MIQREREERDRLQAESEALRLEKAIQEKAEKQKLVNENRYFLEELKIPDYLQAIIEEERLKKAYVLWESTGNVALVWNIELLHSRGRGSNTDERGHTTYFMVTSKSPEEYRYISLSVHGDSKNNLLDIEGRKVSHELFTAELLQPQPPKPFIFKRLSSEFYNPEQIQQALASAYLDTSAITYYEKRGKEPWHWPFEKYVPELNGLSGLTFTE